MGREGLLVLLSLLICCAHCQPPPFESTPLDQVRAGRRQFERRRPRWGQGRHRGFVHLGSREASRLDDGFSLIGSEGNDEGRGRDVGAAGCPPGAATTKFAVLFVGQAGSGWLVSLVNQLPDVFMGDELMAKGRTADQQAGLLKAAFTPPLPQGGSDLRYGHLGRSILLGSPSHVLPAHRLAHVNVREKECASKVGFKVKTHDLIDARRTAQQLVDEGAKVINLVRRDLLKHAVSIDRANMLYHQRKVWHVGEKGTATRPIGPYAIPFKRFRHWVLQITKRRRVLAQFGRMVASLNSLTVAYEDLLADPAGTLHQIAEFLGVQWDGQGVDLGAGVGKNTMDNPSMSVLNWSALVEQLPAHFKERGEQGYSG